MVMAAKLGRVHCVCCQVNYCTVFCIFIRLVVRCLMSILYSYKIVSCKVLKQWNIMS